MALSRAHSPHPVEGVEQDGFHRGTFDMLATSVLLLDERVVFKGD